MIRLFLINPGYEREVCELAADLDDTIILGDFVTATAEDAFLLKMRADTGALTAFGDDR